MKPLFFLLITCTLVVLACQKPMSGNNATLTTTKTAAVKVGEPISFSFTASGDTMVNWQVSPSQDVVIRSSGNKASIFFNQSGSYAVTASSASGTATTLVHVTDSLYVDSTHYQGGTGSGSGSGSNYYASIPLTGDEIKLTPSKLSSDSMQYLVIAGLTGKTYNCLNNYLTATVTSSNGNYTIYYTGVTVPSGSGCTVGTAKAAGNSYLYPITEGTHTLTVLLNGQSYTGSFTRNGSSYTFSWPYTSGVTLSPTAL